VYKKLLKQINSKPRPTAHFLPMASKPILAGRERAKARAEFSLRLTKALNEFPGCPARKGRAKWLATQFSVSTTAAQKWLGGLSMPDQAKMRAIADTLHVDASWLAGLTGESEADTVTIARDRFSVELAPFWPDLPESLKDAFVDLARAHLGSVLPNEDKKK
jgi:transcriptional regulator with XRE-family HTH domain